MEILQSGKCFLTSVLASLTLWLGMFGIAPGSEEAGDGVYVDGEWLVYRGEFSAELNEAAREALLAAPGLRGLKVSSPGGPVDLGMDLGEWMLDAGLDVYIDGYCHSSCANYVFLAGANKILSADGVVGWHGSTRQWSDAQEMCGVPENRLDARIAHRECVARAGDVRAREDAFYARLGLEPLIPVVGLADTSDYLSSGKYSVWTYSLEDMARLGISNVSVDGPEWLPASSMDAEIVCLLNLDTLRCGPLE